MLPLTPSIAIIANRLATLTPGFSGAEIANLCNEAAIIAARNGNTEVLMADFEQASERVIAGIERKTLVEENEKIVFISKSRTIFNHRRLQCTSRDMLSLAGF